MENNSYVIYSNKGGTGKTTLAFQIATEYARLRQREVNVVVIDMCPHANVSQALLTKTDENPSSSESRKVNVSEASKRLIELSSKKEYEQTVGGYLLAMLDRKEDNKRTFNCKEFLIKVHEFNKKIPENVYLLCGDRYLDVLSKRLEQERQLFPTRHDNNPWKRVTLFIKDFIDGLNDYPSSKYTFVIDTNPSFSIYTEMVISAAKRLIVPFTADDFSLSAIKILLYMVYGYESDEDKDERLESSKESQYFWLAQTNGIERSKLYFFVFNRVTFYESRPADAFDAIMDEFLQILIPILKYDYGSTIAKRLFYLKPVSLDVGKIKERYIVDVHDFHSAGIVSLHSGCPIFKVKSGYVYFVYGSKITISRETIAKYCNDICKILKTMYQF